MDHTEGQEVFAGSNDHNTQMIIKGKRTKRRPPSSPAMTSTSSCGDGVSGVGGNSISSPTASSGIYESTEEDEDMANCLILLARGDYDHKMEERSYSRRRFTDVYKCKTCDRIFPSFQALGGHRASHKKPKSMAAEEKKTQVLASTGDFNQEKQFNRTSLHLISDTQIPNKAFPINSKNKIHECSICGAEFTSGQALGGHMRRHRASATVASSHEADNKSRNILALDLNLPAPAEDDHHHRESKFKFVSTQPPLIFSSPALVDCHN